MTACPERPKPPLAANRAPGIFLRRVVPAADTIRFSLAATPTVKPTHDDESVLGNRLFRTLSLVLTPMGILLILGPLSVLQIASTVTGLPEIIVFWLGVAAIFLEYHRHRLGKQFVASTPNGENKEATHESH